MLETSTEMTEKSWIEQIQLIAEKACQAHGCYLYHLEIVGLGQNRTLRVFIDKDVTGSGIDDCSLVSREINEFLDSNEELVPGGNYHLEVSTPGIERVLVQPWHFQRVVGKKVWLKLKETLASFGVTDPHRSGAKQVEVVLLTANELQLEFDENDVRVQIPYGKVEKAKLVFEMSRPESGAKKGHPKKGKNERK